MEFKQWNGFKGGDWKEVINVRDFIQHNYTPYEGDSNFLEKTTEKTDKLWNEVLELYKKEHESEGGVLDIDTKTISTVSAHDAGYIDKDLEEIINCLDILLDGEFMIKLHDDRLHYVGSSNQRILDVKESLRTGKPILYIDNSNVGKVFEEPRTLFQCSLDG